MEEYGISLTLITNKLKQQINNVKSSLKNFSNSAKESGTITFNARTELLKKKINDMKSDLATIDTTNISGKGEALRLSSEIEKAEESLKRLENETDNENKKITGLGSNIEKSMKKSTNSIKRFALSLFSIRSIWALISRASSNYLSQDKQLSTSISKTWASLGAMLTPIIEGLVKGLRTAAAYVNYFIKALTGKDLIGNAVKKINAYNKQLGKTKKNAKEAAKELSSLDEVTNLSFDNASDIEDAAEGFDDFSDIKLNKNVTDILDNWAKTIHNIWEELEPVRKTIGGIVDWSIKNPNSVIKILGGAALLSFISKLTGANGLGKLLSIGVVTAGVDLIYNAVTGKDLITDLKDIISGLKEIRQNSKNAADSSEYLAEKSKGVYETFSNNINEYAKDTQKIFSINESFIGTSSTIFASIKQYRKLMLNTLDPKAVKEYEKSLISATKNEKANSDAVYLSYKNGLLSNIQKEEFIKILKEEIDFYEKESNRIGISAEQSKVYKDRVEDLKGKLKDMSSGTYTPKVEIETYQANKNIDSVESNLNALNSIKVNNSIGIGVGSALSNIDSVKEGLNGINGKKVSASMTLDTKTSTAKTRLVDYVTKALNALKKAPFGLFGNITDSLVNQIVNSVKSLPSFDVGTNYIPNDMIAQVHKGEMIVPAKYNPSTSGIGLGNSETNSLLVELNRNVLELSNKPTILNVNGKELAQATYKDYQNEGNRLNSSSSIFIR